ncbi:glycosyltransferase family 4 protein [Candidatus Pacearchaeota archaeon]|nr:glycosyltransferase family 4 protein [Candidatus Pacearchaeota archaeon]
MDYKTKICFFSVGFAFNRLVRLRYYEKIFPKDVEIFLITTDKYGNAKEEEKKWGLNRTKVVVLKHNPIKNIFEIRKICDKNKIDILSNLGHPFGSVPLLFARIFRHRKVFLYYLGDVLEIFKTTKMSFKKVKLFLILIPYFILSKITDKSAFVGHRSYKRAPYFFLSSKNKFCFLQAPVNVNLFRPYDKVRSRKKLGIDKEKKVVIYVGRVTYLKGGDILSEIIKLNPDIDFIVIGKWIEEEIPMIRSKNLRFIERVPNEKLPEYYSASDLTFVYNRQGDQPQITGSESLACGVPVLHTERFYAPDESFIIRIKDDVKDADKKLKTFFTVDKKKRKIISTKAREYAVSSMSDEFWKGKYIDFFLK